MRKTWNQICVTLPAAILLALALNGCAKTDDAAPESPAAETTVAGSEAKETEEAGDLAEEGQKPEEGNDGIYLKTYFDVAVLADSLEAGSFSADLKKIAGEEAPAVEGDLTSLKAVVAAVTAAGYKELALGYPVEKTEARLKQYGISRQVDSEFAPYLACAMDTGLITKEEGMKAADNQAMAAPEAEALLMAVANANGDGRNYLGTSDSHDIYARVDQAWNSFLLFDDGKLSEIGKQAVEQGITTGYGIKSSAYAARFLPDLTLQYGHSDIKHAHQLLGLLNSENIIAKVQLEPKVSIYQYLLEWGPIPEATPTYEVKQFGDLYLVYAVEYDLLLEFANTEDLMKFDGVIKSYAKKNEGNEEGVGMIYGSWWQPLYSTVRTDMPSEDFHQIYDCVIENGVYSIHPFTLPDNKDEVTARLKALAGDLPVNPVERFCNTAFYSYMTGEDYQ